MANVVRKFLNNFEDINEYYNFLVEKTKQLEYVGISNEWLIDNFYLLVEHKTNILANKKDIIKGIKASQKITFCIKEIVINNNYNISLKILTTALKKYQRETKQYFSYKEIANIKEILLFIYVERLNQLCKEEYKKLLVKEKVANMIEEKTEKEIELENFIKEDFKITNNSYYIFELNNQLKELGNKSNKLFKDLNELLKTKQISLKEIINDEYQRKIDNDILISNIFNDLKEFFEFNNEDLFEKVSKTEKLLMDCRI